MNGETFELVNGEHYVTIGTRVEMNTGMSECDVGMRIELKGRDEDGLRLYGKESKGTI